MSDLEREVVEVDIKDPLVRCAHLDKGRQMVDRIIYIFCRKCKITLEMIKEASDV